MATPAPKTSIADHIELTPGVCGGHPRIAGTRIRVQDVAVWHESEGQAAEEILAHYPQLSLADIYAALAYYFDHREEIERQITKDDAFAETIEAELASPPKAQPPHA